MALDNMYLENLDEYINDENKIVTYKWLSSTLQVHVNVAKQMLYSFVQNQRNEKENDGLSVVYFVAGLSKPTDDAQVHRSAVVREEDLTSYKSMFAMVTSCHIYSVQKVKFQDSSPLYLADYNELKNRIFETNKYGAVQCANAKLRSESDMASIRSSHKPSDTPSTTKPTLSNGSATTTEHKPAAKPQQKKGIAGMFATAAKKTDSSEKNNADVAKDEKKEARTSKNTAEKKGGVMAFFSKQPEKKSESTSSPTTPSVAEKTEPKKQSPSSPSPVKRKTAGKSKKAARDSDSDEESVGNKKKRRRIRDTIFESSSEEEIEIDDDNPIPSPAKAPPLAPDSPLSSPEKKANSPTKDDRQGERTTGERRRKRRRKLVPKTFKDEEGFIVTEKVWESESTDASEIEEPPPKPQPKVTTPEKKTKKTPPAKSKKKASPAKGSKQTSMMSFFKKK